MHHSLFGTPGLVLLAVTLLVRWPLMAWARRQARRGDPWFIAALERDRLARQRRRQLGRLGALRAMWHGEDGRDA
jgi:hypothetical protein